MNSIKTKKHLINVKKMRQKIHKFSEPFPHLIVENMYNEEELELICNFLELKQIKNFLYQDYHVKMIGLNHNEIELSRVSPDLQNATVTYPSYGIIEDEICLYDEGVMQLVDWAKENIEIPEYLI